jgi:hypothetical protein
MYAFRELPPRPYGSASQALEPSAKRRMTGLKLVGAPNRFRGVVTEVRMSNDAAGGPL